MANRTQPPATSDASWLAPAQSSSFEGAATIRGTCSSRSQPRKEEARMADDGITALRQERPAAESSSSPPAATVSRSREGTPRGTGAQT